MDKLLNKKVTQGFAATPWSAPRKMIVALIGLVVIAVGIAIAIPLCLTGGAMSAGQLADQQSLAAAQPHAKLKFVVEVGRVEIAGGQYIIEAQLLKKESEDIYRRTGGRISIRATRAIKFVMGNEKDLTPGAIVHVTGEKSDDDIEATQIVILTGYVKIK